MAETLEPGDRVAWRHSQGTSTGKVVHKITRRTHIKDHKVAASPDHPEYIVESDKTGARAAHTRSGLRKL